MKFKRSRNVTIDLIWLQNNHIEANSSEDLILYIRKELCDTTLETVIK